MLTQLSFKNLALVRCCKSLQSAAGRERGKREEREKGGRGRIELCPSNSMILPDI